MNAIGAINTATSGGSTFSPPVFDTRAELDAAQSDTIRQLRGDLSDALRVIDQLKAEKLVLLSSVRILSNHVEIC
jgi:hypothetical protein